MQRLIQGNGSSHPYGVQLHQHNKRETKSNRLSLANCSARPHKWLCSDHIIALCTPLPLTHMHRSRAHIQRGYTEAHSGSLYTHTLRTWIYTAHTQSQFGMSRSGLFTRTRSHTWQTPNKDSHQLTYPHTVSRLRGERAKDRRGEKTI